MIDLDEVRLYVSPGRSTISSTSWSQGRHEVEDEILVSSHSLPFVSSDISIELLLSRLQLMRRGARRQWVLAIVHPHLHNHFLNPEVVHASLDQLRFRRERAFSEYC